LRQVAVPALPTVRPSLAAPLALCWLALIVHASLYPFSGWRSQDVPPWAYLSAPWSPYWTAFDVGANLTGYLPFGFLLTLALLRSGHQRLAWLAGLLAPALLSLLLEGLQSYLPQRVPSRLDLLLNAGGGATGALLAQLSVRLTVLRVWDRFRAEWLSQEAPLGYVVLLLWPLALLYPTPVPFGLGQVWLRLQSGLSGWLQDTPFAPWMPVPVEAPALSPLLLALAIALSLVAPALLGFALLPQRRQRLWLLLLWALTAPALLAVSAALTHGPARAWDGFTPPVRLGLLLALLLALAGLRRSVRTCAVLLLLTLGLALGLLNGAAESPYFAAAAAAWSGGPFLRVHGLLQWLGWIWPYATLGLSLQLALRMPSRHYNAST
jgi:VanZ family protein